MSDVRKRAVHKLDRMSIANLPDELTVISFTASNGETVVANFKTMLALGDRCDDPFAVQEALDQISAMRAFWGTQLAFVDDKIERLKDGVGALEGELKVELPGLLAARGLKTTVDSITQHFAATVTTFVNVSSSDEKLYFENLQRDWNPAFADVCMAYRGVVKRLRKYKRIQSQLRVVNDALSSRSYSLTHMADLLSDMMSAKIVDVSVISK